jgi:peptide/nickel transport system ATP-binding protein
VIGGPEPGGGEADPPLLVVDDMVTRIRTGRGELRAVDGVSFTLRAGETLGVVGESGSGKSVLVRSIMNLIPANASVEGQVRFDGRDIASLDRAERKHFWGQQIAMIFQDPMTSLNPVRTVGVQLTDPLRYHLQLSRKDARQRAIEMLDLVRIPQASARLKQYPHELSGGMRQRVMIAIALSCRPKLLIADEPTTALDVTVQKQVLDLLGGLQREMGMGMILISHDLGVVAGRTQRTAVMYAGKFVERAATSTLFARRRHPYTAALLESIPRIDGPRSARLTAIAGRPPDLLSLPVGCRFRPRCSRAEDICATAMPPLASLPGGSADHLVACYRPVEQDAPGRETPALSAAGQS